MIGWLVRHGIEPHIRLLDREHQTKGFFTRADFTFDPQANAFVCPAGKRLRSSGMVREDGTEPYCGEHQRLPSLRTEVALH